MPGFVEPVVDFVRGRAAKVALRENARVDMDQAQPGRRALTVALGCAASRFEPGALRGR
jgi:hypothetical protein